MGQHVELKRLREELALREERRRQAEQRRADLEKLYCEQEMEKVAGEYMALQTRFDNLVGRTLNLAKSSIERAQLKPVEGIVSSQHQQHQP